MPLTNTQLDTLKAAIAADGTLSQIPHTPDGAFEVAAALNQTVAPNFFLWASSVSTHRIREVLVWSEYDALSVSKQNAFSFLCSNGIVDARLPNVRQGIASIFTGPNQAGNLAALVGIAKRLATRAEKLFATGTGSEASPAASSFTDGFQLAYQDVLAAWERP